MSAIIVRMAEPLPTLHRTAGQWLALSRKHAPLGEAIAERFGDNVNSKGLGRWLKKQIGTAVDGVKLIGRYDKHRKQWLYWAGKPPPAEPLPQLPSAAELLELRRKLALELPKVPQPQTPEKPREMARFVNPRVVTDEVTGVSKFVEPLPKLEIVDYVPPPPFRVAVKQPVLTGRDARPDVVEARRLHAEAQRLGNAEPRLQNSIHPMKNWSPF